DVPEAALRTGPMPTQGLVVTLDADTVTAFARRSAFDSGAVMGIQPEPRSLAVRGDRLALGLRLWGGTSWYRDFDVDAKVAVSGGQLVVSEPSVRETRASDGAAAADPLAYVVSGVVPEVLSRLPDVAFGVPATHASDEGRKRTTATLSGLSGNGEALVVRGDLEIGRVGHRTKVKARRGGR
ncbi:MAG: hypothetical protein KC656_29850, partial [Myxococcales bacterium]|nr:hypothetical protein [Myxococcales bacterium]